MIPLVDPIVAFAFGAGVVTFFAPCAYPLLPGYVAYFLGSEDGDLSLKPRLLRAAMVGGLTSLGFFLVYAALAGAVATVGTGPLRNVAVLEPIVGLLLIVLGIGMGTGRFSPAAMHVQLPERRRSVVGYFGFGVVYAAAAAGCTAPVFVGIALAAISSPPATAIAAFGAYALGMSVLMIAVTLLSALGHETVLRRLSRSSGRITRVAGVLLVVAGLVQIYFYLFEFGGLQALGLA